MGLRVLAFGRWLSVAEGAEWLDCRECEFGFLGERAPVRARTPEGKRFSGRRRFLVVARGPIPVHQSRFLRCLCEGAVLV